MENDDFNEAEYIKGFNEGWMLVKYAPELSEILAKSTSGKGSRLEGAKDAREVYIDEQMDKDLPDWLRDDYFRRPEVLPDNEKDRDIDLEL